MFLTVVLLAVIAYQLKRFVDIVASYQPAHLKAPKSTWTTWPQSARGSGAFNLASVAALIWLLLWVLR